MCKVRQRDNINYIAKQNVWGQVKDILIKIMIN